MNKLVRLFALFVTLSTLLAGAASADELASQFASPLASARPWVYWFWLDGNITREGITADLEAMQRTGIGGVLIMEVDQGAPKGPARFGSPAWRELFKHVCAEASRLGLEVNMNNDAGWCGSGGPWITPELAMQKMVWTETAVEGPRRFEGPLPKPQAMANFYRDIAVLAFPTPEGNARIEGLQGKAVFTPLSVALAAPATWPSAPPGAMIPRDRIVDLTANLRPDGQLPWDVPPGKWTILRLGHTPTGAVNSPAPADCRGLECDKLSKEAAEAHFAGLMGKLIADVGPLAGKTLVSTHIDSWEVGVQNWTPRMREEFQRLRGYDLLRWLPVMTGRVVGSVEMSERFLWDLRQTISELVLENYAGHFRTMAHRHGMRLSIEAYNTCPCDEMAYAGRADEPMGEFWSWSKYGSAFSCTEMASAAHVYGKRIVGAEAFTATDAEKWLGHPGNIKDLGDWAFCEGINRFVFHRYALQPWRDVKPGMSMGPWGLHYERTQTWWELSKPWHEYLARCQYVLQQGLFVADICMLGPEGSPQSLNGQKSFLSKTPGGGERPLERPGYNFDACPPEVVLTRMSVKDGRLVLPDGMSYRVLVLPRLETMTPQLLRKIKELVEAGATVIGSPPAKSPSLTDYPKCDDEVRRLAAELWGTGNSRTDLKSVPPGTTDLKSVPPSPARITERPIGKGRIVWGGELTKGMGLKDGEPARLGPSARWIWRKEGNPAVAVPPGKRYFRRVVNVEAGGRIQSARLVMTADNGFESWVNGRKAGEGDNFTRTYVMDVTPFVKPGANLVAVAATNGGEGPNPAGLIASLEIRYQNGRTLEASTDRTWEAAGKVQGNWTVGRIGNPSHPAAAQGWSPAMELGPLGMAPWGDVQQSLSSPDRYADVDIVCDWLEKRGVRPDFAVRESLGFGHDFFDVFFVESKDPGFRYIHRRIGQTDVYFVANGSPNPEGGLCVFRVRGRRPELWWPDTGRIERPAVYNVEEDSVRVPLRLGPSGSVFVVFRGEAGIDKDRVMSVTHNGVSLLDASKEWFSIDEIPDLGPGERRLFVAGKSERIRLTRTAAGGIEARVWEPGKYELRTADGRQRSLEVAELPKPLEIAGPWEVRFSPGGGAPDRVTLPKLISWSDHPDPGVKYYSGAATYRRKFSVPAGLVSKDREFMLDLGRVQVIAQVKLNGQDLGILWKEPFRIDVTGRVKPGDNDLEVKVVNLWINRMIGDEELAEDSQRNPNGTLKRWPQWLQEGKPSPTDRHTFTSWKLWPKGSPLQPSGLLGPVRLHAGAKVSIQ